MSALGIKGVHYDKHMDSYVGKMTIGGTVYRKTFKNKDDAVAYRKDLEALYLKGDSKVDNRAVPTPIAVLVPSLSDVQDKVMGKVVDKYIKTRPQNFCVKDETFEVTYERNTQWFTRENMTDGTLERNSFTSKELNFRLIYKDNATIVILEDGCKGVAKCGKGDTFSRKKGLQCALARAMAEHYAKEF